MLTELTKSFGQYKPMELAGAAEPYGAAERRCGLALRRGLQLIPT
jgi:hypothetical protein